MTQIQEKNKPPLDLLEEINFLPEWILDELEDPLCNLSPGASARLGAALARLGEILTENAKNAMYGVKNREDQGVLFDTIEPTSYPAIDSDAIKRDFPIATFPHYYVNRNRKGYVLPDLPFTTKKVRQLPTTTGSRRK